MTRQQDSITGKMTQSVFFVLLVLRFYVPCSALYKQIDDNSTLYWASESRLDGDPLHSYSRSRSFCQSLGGDLPIGTSEEMLFLKSFLPIDTYPYWLGQGE